MGTIASRCSAFLSLVCLLGFWVQPVEGAKRTMDFAELMKIRKIEQPVISEKGDWVAYALVPDRGDGEVVVRSSDARRRVRLPRGAAPLISADGAWVASRLEPSFEERETAEEGEAPRSGAVLLATSSGDTLHWADVQSFAFSDDGRWFALLHHPPREEQAEADSTQAAADPDSVRD